MSTVTAPEPIRIILADDHLVVRAGLKALLDSASDIRVVGEASTGQDALALIDRVAPDVAVLDLEMPVMDGLATLRSLIAAHSPTRVLILTLHDDDQYLATSLEAGAAGYLSKDVADRALADAIRAVASGEIYVHPTAGRALARHLVRQAEHRDERMQYETLSERERDVVLLVAEGRSASEIGQRLMISPRTVDTHKQRLSERLHLSHRSEYVQFCLRLDLLHAR